MQAWITQLHIHLQNYWFTYNEQISVESVTQSVSNLAMQFGEDEEDAMVNVCSRVAKPQILMKLFTLWYNHQIFL